MTCYPCAPGAENARAALEKDPSAMQKEVLFFAERCLLVGVGLFAAGFRKDQLWKGALAGGAAVELFVLGYVAWNNRSGGT